MQYTHVIWDFNGTIMDDVDIAVAAVNDMLDKRGMARTNRADYLQMIESPIIEYYKKIFDLSVVSFEDIQVEFLESYNRRLPEAGLLPGVQDTLERFSACGLHQCVISSFEQERLRRMVHDLGIGSYFDSVSGADNTRAEGKVERGLQWLRESGADPRRVLVLGDLDHDFELASRLGADCILIAAGHQHRRALERCGCPVLDSAARLADFLNL
ncbi:MAG: HAD family hydrolase [Clostridia bacterium]|nr:HAD family hydrolase [Clostridia bacterium]MBQ9924408.1 HAD family hydrolase [Clostridia bacterium]